MSQTTNNIALTRKQWFAKLKGAQGVIHNESFGLFLERLTGVPTPFEINHPSCEFFGDNCPCRRNEPILEKGFNVDSCSRIETIFVAAIINAYEESFKEEDNGLF
jgi:hypothetical protein